MSIIATTDVAIKQGMPVIVHSGAPVVTTEQLAKFYGTDCVRLRQNHKRNSERFISGKHFHKVDGKNLADLRVSLSDSQIVVSPKTRSLILWTERGAARHAKMLETDRAWDVFEKLEDFYFSQRGEVEPVRKVRQSTATQLIPLRQTAERLITTGIGKIYPDIWKLVHERFDVEHIHQLQPTQIKEAVAYLDGLEGEFIGKQSALPVPSFDFQMYVHNANVACIHMEKVYEMWMDELRPSLRAVESPLATKLNDRIVDATAIIGGIRRALEKASGLKGLQYREH
ncbi:ORF6N domain-containing protein [Pectobacterium brasiliense]|uniref:ORF6N domain-containing protein n=1 Tax=Pectobacterium brasiliense TaxID=180957 RepID=UPI0039877AAA